MDSSWDKSCIKASTRDVEHMTSLGLESNINKTPEEKIFYYRRGIGQNPKNSPILVLIHGYPQTNFMWRHIPGYGRSAPLAGPHDKHSVGLAILEALRKLPIHPSEQKIIIAGHDRGARVCHRIAVDASSQSQFRLLGTIFMDIVPTLHQWASNSSPMGAVMSFHWSFLANVDFATVMIKAQGGDIFVRSLFTRWAGRNELSNKKLDEHDAIDVYAKSFKYESVIRASCDDYRAGAQEDIKLQEEDQKAGRKIDIDVLALYSAHYLGKRYDIQEVWSEWMGKGKLEVEGFGDGVGHFIAEEVPEKTASAMVAFYNKHV
ncbi:hypothetical protein G7Y89_g2439 [Cudoniella acicularis]|uniref:AB hydrolase-1 domain-containing protein n=1 Tax=Cudoniella acicularis TaxID=354080 RepID=A0A8H4RV70_9HELO|nr:hypothetical protein G7Y89_g2439 [Cudoniella acicularis]